VTNTADRAPRTVANTGAGADTSAPASGRAASVFANASSLALVLALLLSVVVFGALRPDSFLSTGNLQAILTQAAAPMVLAIGLTIPLAQGDFDLSIGAMLGLGGAVAISLQTLHGVNWVVALAAAFVVALLVGFVNGLLVAWFEASSFITTLAMATILLGVEYLFTNQQTLYGNISQSYLNLGQSALAGINVQVYIAVVVALVAWFYLDQTEAGRYTYAIGGNPNAARFAGVRVARYRMLGFVLVALAACLTGVMLTAQAGSSTPNSGVSYMLPAFAAVFLGATCFKPGVFNVWGTVVASLFLPVISTGLQMLHVSTAVINILQGGILIVAMLFGKLERKHA
jgi:ribose transport system permease protein